VAANGPSGVVSSLVQRIVGYPGKRLRSPRLYPRIGLTLACCSRLLFNLDGPGGSAVQAEMSELRQLAEKHGTDKGLFCHIYEKHLGHLRRQPITLLEIGIGGDEDPLQGGASLRMWKEYFEFATIHGIDLYDKSYCREDRIFTYQGSQDDRDFLSRVANQIGDIDVIIDDGCHFSPQVIKSFNVLFPRLKVGGVYVVEDIATSYWEGDYMGSADFLNPTTSMFFFKTLTDGIMHPHSMLDRHWTYADLHTESVHFYCNLVLVVKK
jgi:hypothetical protein